MLTGIDVSTLQGNINWHNVKADFAMIKASRGRGEGANTRHLRKFTDSKFATNIKAATSAGIQCGVYHYMTAQSVQEANEEADYFLSVIAPYRDKITLWAAVDVESDMYLPTSNGALLAYIVEAFATRVKAAGYKPMLYTNRDYMLYKINMDYLSDIDIWQAHWSKNKPNDVGGRLKIWQYGVGTVSGINANCDLNYGYFDVPTITTPSREIKAGDHVRIIAGAKYTNGVAVPDRLVGFIYTVTSVNSAGVYIAALVSRIKRDGLELV